MSAVNNFITDIMDQMLDKRIHSVTFMPLVQGAYMVRPKNSEGKFSGRRVHAGDEFIEDMAALGFNVKKRQDEKYFIETDDSNSFRRFRLEVVPSKVINNASGNNLIHLHYLGTYTKYRMEKELAS